VSGRFLIPPGPEPFGLNWKTVGFAYLGGTGQADLILSNANADTQQTDYEIFDIANLKIDKVSDLGLIGSDWRPLGVGRDASTSGLTRVDLMVVRASQSTSNAIDGVLGAPPGNTTIDNPILAYGISQGVVFSASYMGPTGLDFIGFGQFNTDFPIGGIMMRNPDNGDIWIYDITQDSTGRYSMTGGKVAISAANVGNFANYTPVGLAPLNQNLNETDLVMQDTSGNLWFYDILKDALGPSGQLMAAEQVGRQFTAAFGADLSTSSTAVSQLGQAMASFGASSGAAESLNTAPLGADTSQQTLLTTPQHA
jgi:hypothetical protein